MSAIRFPVLAALCTSAFCYAQAPPSTVEPATQERPVTMPADIVRDTPPVTPAATESAPDPASTRAMGATGRPATLTSPADDPPARAPAQAPVESVGRYGNGYLP